MIEGYAWHISEYKIIECTIEDLCAFTLYKKSKYLILEVYDFIDSNGKLCHERADSIFRSKEEAVKHSAKMGFNIVNIAKKETKYKVGDVIYKVENKDEISFTTFLIDAIKADANKETIYTLINVLTKDEIIFSEKDMITPVFFTTKKEAKRETIRLLCINEEMK